MAITDQVLTKTQRKNVGKGKLEDDVPMSKAQRESSRRMARGDKGELATGLMLLPVSALGPVSSFIASKGVAAAGKKFGTNIVRMAKKYFSPTKKQTMKKGDRKTDEEAYVVYKKPIGTKNKQGLESLEMKKVSEAEGKKLLLKGNVRKATLGATVGLIGGVAASTSKDNKKDDKEELYPDPYKVQWLAKQVLDERGTKSAPKPKPESKPKPVARKKRDPKTSRQPRDSGAYNERLIKQQAEEENIGTSAAEQNLKKGGLVRSKTTKKSKYGMKAGGFTGRGTMHRAHKK
jgi:hypothetical protein